MDKFRLDEQIIKFLPWEFYYASFVVSFRSGAGVSRSSRKVFAPGKPQRNLKRYDYRAVLFNRGSLYTRNFRPIYLSVFNKIK